MNNSPDTRAMISKGQDIIDSIKNNWEDEYGKKAVRWFENTQQTLSGYSRDLEQIYYRMSEIMNTCYNVQGDDGDAEKTLVLKRRR